MIDVNLLDNRAFQDRFAAGQPIMQSDNIREMYVVVSGTVEAYDATTGKPSGKIFRAGHVFGEQTFFDGTDTTLFRAKEDTTVFVIAEDTFDHISGIYPRIMFELLHDAYLKPNSTTFSKHTGHISNKTQTAEGASTINARELLLQRIKPVMQPLTQHSDPTQYPTSPTQPIASSPAVSALFPPGHKGYPRIYKPEYKKYLFEKEYQCPNCGKPLKGHKVFISKLIPSVPMRYDLRKHFKDFETEWYDITTCPSCYFSAFTDFFTEPVDFSKHKIQAAMTAVHNAMTLNFDAERDLDFVFTSYFLALLCSPAFHAQHQIDLRLWSNISWLYEDIGDLDMERYAAGMAAKTGEAIYLSGNLNKVQEQIVCLSTAGMLYRSGEMKNVMRWLFNAKTAKMGKKLYADLAESLMDTIRDQQDSKK